MTQQERLKKLFEESAIPYTDDNGKPEPCFNDDIFIRVASELLEEREKQRIYELIELFKLMDENDDLQISRVFTWEDRLQRYLRELKEVDIKPKVLILNENEMDATEENILNFPGKEWIAFKDLTT